MAKREGFYLWLSLVIGLVFTCTWAQQQSRFAAVCDAVRADTLRLHIVASGNTVAEQSLKLRVRDAILEETQRLCSSAPDQETAREILSRSLPQLTRTAQQVLAREGHPMAVRAEMEQSYFTTAHYAQKTLPAGEYDAVRITLGSGSGHNWWCCLYPSLCLSASAGYETPAENAVVTDGGYEIRFALVEWWQKHWVRKNKLVPRLHGAALSHIG